MRSVWVLTREDNEYNQNGTYFETVFFEKPYAEQIADFLGISEENACHIISVGGRMKNEDSWWYLTEHVE